MTNKTTEAPFAAYANKAISPLMQDYVAWIEEQTGYQVDAMSVQLSGVLRTAFQKSQGNQERLAKASAANLAEAAARAERKVARQAAAAARAAEKKTLDTKPVEKPAPKAPATPAPASRRRSTKTTEVSA